MNRQPNSLFGESETIHRDLRIYKIVGVAFGSLLLMSTSHLALAQTGVPSDNPPARSSAVSAPTDKNSSGDNGQLDEVVVTANKRAETLLKAPTAVSVVTMQALESAGAAGVQDLNSLAPNTEIRTVGVDNGMNISIRGVSDSSYNDNATSSVATYVDGVYVGRTEGLAGSLYDLDRIEVLRGPQGTLYGRNSAGGNFNIQTANPKQDFDASAALSYGNYNEVQENAMLNVPVTDTLAVRGAISYRRNDGYENTLGSTANNYNKADDYAGRLTILWKPTDEFKWRVSVDDYVSHGTPSLDEQTTPDGKPLNGGSPYKQVVNNVEEPWLYVNNLMVRSRMDLSLGDIATLSYIAGYQDVADQPQVVLVDDPFFRNTPSKSTTQEVDLNIDTGRIHDVLGANYYFQHFYSTGDADFITAGAPLSADSVFLAHGDAITLASGVFNQMTFDATDSLKVTGGVRYSHEGDGEKNNYYTFCSLAQYPPSTYPVRTLLPQQFTLPGCATVPAIYGGNASARVTASSVNWKAGLEYDVSDHTTTYFNITTGFKAGGINLGPSPGVDAADSTFQPEHVKNYEAGLKTRLFDNRVGLNTAIFYTDYTNIQVSQLSGNGLADITTNASAARMYGVETEGQWRITSDDRLSGFFNYLNAKYNDYRDAVDQQFGTVYPSLDGRFLPYSPEFSGRVEFTHQMFLENDGVLSATAAVYWQADSYLREFNLPVDKVPAYSKTDLELKYVFPQGRFNISAYGHNLENNAVRNGSYAYVGSYLSSYSPPRTFGIRASYKY